MPIFTQFTPNIQTKEVLQSLFYLSPLGWPLLKTGPKSEQLQLELEEYFQKPVTLFDSGRSALYAILHNRPKTKVLVQAYTCVVVINAILKAGHTPVYVDTEEDSLNISLKDLEKKISKDTKILIVQHTYGNPDQIDEIKKLCQKHKIYLIEDLAHSLTATYNSQKLGTFGDAAFVSFGTGKIISCSRGGAAINLKTTPPGFAPATQILSHHLKHILFAMAKPIYFLAHLGKIILYIARKLKLIPDIITLAEKKLQTDKIQIHSFPNSLAAIALTQWHKKTLFKHHRQHLAKIYDTHLSIPQVKTYPRYKNSACMMYPIQAEKSDKLFTFLKRNHIIVDQFWSKAAIVPKDVDQKKTHYKPGTCKNAENQLHNELNLPLNIHVTPKQAHKVCQLIQDFYDSPR